MIEAFRNFFEDEEDTTPSFILMTRNILFFVIFVNIALLPVVSGLLGEGTATPIALIALSITLIVEIIALALVLRGITSVAKLAIPLALIAAIGVISYGANGIRSTAFIGFPVVLVVAVLLMGRRAVWIITPLALIVGEFIAIIDLQTGRVAEPIGIDDAIIIALMLIGCSAIIQIMVKRLDESLAKARESERTQKERAAELEELKDTLEERVSERTFELEAANQRNQRRARQFEAIALVTRAVSSIQDLATLLPNITNYIHEQFGHYYVAIYLHDEKREFAVLRASNHEVGKKLMAENWRMSVGRAGIIGYVSATGQTRVAQDVEKDIAYINDPNLPNTRSEIALPLRFGGLVIGVLDVQSIEHNAFEPEDIDALTTLADQISIAINNAQTLEESRKALAESRRAYDEATQESWKVMRPKSLGIGFGLSGGKAIPLEQPLTGTHIGDALNSNEAVTSGASEFAVPIRLRGKVIGIMNLKSSAELTDDTVDIVEAVAERLSLAIETATLLQTAQHRADIERITTDIASKIGSSTRFESILQTAAQELSRALGGSDVIVQIEPASIELGMSNKA